MRERNQGNEKVKRPRRGRWSQAELARLKELYGLREDASIARELNRPLQSVRKMADKLFSGPPRQGPWTAGEIEDLKRFLGRSDAEVIARILRRPAEEVARQIAELDRIKEDTPWTRDEIQNFKRIYGTRTDEALASVFSRPLESVQELAREHALAKDKAFTRKMEGESSTKMPRWSPEEIELLRQLYPEMANLDIARKLDRTVKSVVSKAHNLGLKKSIERLQTMGRENVSLRYGEDEAVLRPARRARGTGGASTSGSSDGVARELERAARELARPERKREPAAESEKDD